MFQSCKCHSHLTSIPLCEPDQTNTHFPPTPVITPLSTPLLGLVSSNSVALMSL
jgi:hypothetical protein